MTDADRFRLLGNYQTPRFRYGQAVFCEVRGWVSVVGLSGLRLAPFWPWEVYRRKWQRRAVYEPDDRTAAPHTWSGFAWEGMEPNRIPWSALKSAWRRTAAPLCLNCDRPALLTNFGFPWSGMFNRRPLFIHTCGKCARLFEDRSVGDVGKWIVNNLEAEVWPDHDMVWDRTREWEPPGGGKEAAAKA